MVLQRALLGAESELIEPMGGSPPYEVGDPYVTLASLSTLARPGVGL